MYKGFRTITEEALSNYYEETAAINPSPINNEFFMLEESKELLRYKGGQFERLKKKKVRSEYGDFSCKNLEQEMAADLLLDDDVKLVVLIGKAGCGKTYMAANIGLFKLDKRKYERLFFVRNNVEVAKPLGSLPGDKFDKIRPYAGSIVDQLGGWSMVYYLIEEENKLEFEALGYMQGRSLRDSYIIVDEAQNLTKAQVKMLVTRVAEGSKMVLCGDLEQAANDTFENGNSGLKHLIEKFNNQPLFGIVELQKSERSRLAELAGQLL